MTRYSPFAALILLVATAVAFGVGVLSANNAFFVAAAIGIVATAMQFAGRAPASFGAALRAILTSPQSYRGKFASYAAYLAVTVLTFAFSANMVAVA